MFDSLLTQKLKKLQVGAILPPVASDIYLFLQRQEVHFPALALFYQTSRTAESVETGFLKVSRFLAP